MTMDRNGHPDLTHRIPMPELTAAEMQEARKGPEAASEVMRRRIATPETEDDGFQTVHPNLAEFRAIGDVARDVTLVAAIERIGRKAEIMALDAARGTPARQDAEEIRLLAGIALRCLRGE